MKFQTRNAQLLGILVLLQIIMLPLSQVVNAASTGSTFTTSLTTTGVSSAPPTVPSNVLSTPISDTQINLTWTASLSGGTYAIDGYRIFRDSIFLATTSTATSYTDTGLFASTTYAYTVEAFDTNLQFSGQSATTSTTTLQTPVVSPSPTPSNSPITSQGGGSSSSGTVMQIYGVHVAAHQNDAVVSFETSMPSQSKVFWGLTSDLELGSLGGLIYGTDHELDVNGLEAGTTYVLRIEATNSQGVTVSVQTTFTTTSTIPVYPIANPSNFVATPVDGHIALSWENPNDLRFDSVRIVRSEAFFPKDQFDGVPVYEGNGQGWNDTNVTVGKTYYYSIFSKSSDGTFSSGALSKSRIVPAGEIVITGSSTDPFANIPNSENVDPMIRALTLADFDFIQEGKVLSQVNNTVVAVNGAENLIIRLKYEKVPEILKTIAITLADPKDPSKVFPFLLRVNASKSYYEATIAPLGRSGNYAMNIVILDYQNQGLRRIAGNLQALVFAAIPADIRRGFDPAGFVLLVFILLLLILLVLFLRHRHARRLEVRDSTVSFN